MKKLFILAALILALQTPMMGCKGGAGKTAMGVYKTTCKALTWICRYKDVICARAVAKAAEAAKKQSPDHTPVKAGSTKPE
jgi:hypothetical protein